MFTTNNHHKRYALRVYLCIKDKADFRSLIDVSCTSFIGEFFGAISDFILKLTSHKSSKTVNRSALTNI
ncbi:CLUMA_CG001863, isoform A [Clunio marinus]|uniref:CLUMA_CG001863, isoform A n=1 Tax=Clunio marinus TaxID=568069 RepID=A0A1J1HNN0_9DIPT|nr:CLUMA_CG001863, isoform A [Clunio marinus]